MAVLYSFHHNEEWEGGREASQKVPDRTSPVMKEKPMLHRTVKNRRSVLVLLALVPLILSPALVSAAIDTNVIPFGYSFEGDPYVDGMTLLGTNGWTGIDDDDNLIIWTTNRYLYPGAYPLDKEGTNILAITAPSTNHVRDDGSPTFGHNVYVDLLIRPTFWSEDEQPVATNNPQMAFYVNSNGLINVWATWQDDGATNHTEWIELAHNPFETGLWKRISISMSYNPWVGGIIPSVQNYFRLTLDNKQYLTNYYGQTAPLAWDHDGPWFLSSDWEDPVHAMHQLEFSGVSFIDDYVVTTQEPPLGLTVDIKSIKGTGIDANPPDNIVPVITGTNKTFTFWETEGYNLTNIAWGVGFSDAARTNYLGPGTNSFTFTNVTEDMSIEAFSETEKRTLVVLPPAYGTPTPAETNIYEYNQNIAASIDPTTIDVGDGTRTQQAVIGWTRWMDSGTTNNGTSTSFNFPMKGTSTTDRTYLDWIWNLQYMLTTSNDGPGQITGASAGWKNEGTSWTLTAEPEPWTGWGWKFDSWSGDTNGCAISNNVCDNTVMDQARDIVAHYVEETYSPMGVDLNYYYEHDISNNFYASSYAADMGDWDSDGLKNWEEYVAGTCMTNEFSIFEVLYTEAFDGSNSVTFYGTTNSGLGHIPYGMYRATNLMDDATSLWSLVSQDIERANDGTNVWWDESPPDGVAIYLPIATNDPAVSP